MEGLININSDTLLQLSFDIKAKRRPIDLVKFIEKSNDYECDLVSREILSLLNERVWIFCLSKNRDSLLMWAHNAENYTGGIIEFDE